MLVLGPFREALEHASLADELLRGLGQRPMVHRNEPLTARLHWILGEVDDGLQVAASGVVGGREVGNRHDQSAALTSLGLAALADAQLERALTCGQEAVELAVGAGSPYLEASARCLGFFAETEVSRGPELGAGLAAAFVAEERLAGDHFLAILIAQRGVLEAWGGRAGIARRSFAEAERFGRDRPFAHLLGTWAEVLCWERLGDTEGLALAGERLRGIAADSGSRLFMAWAAYARMLGMVVASGTLTGAESGAADAIEAPGAQLAWRKDALLARLGTHSDRATHADRHRARAGAILRRVADDLTEPRMRGAFLSRPDVAAALADQL
jgi:hypothetical protein